jgi:hypothetical protein
MIQDKDEDDDSVYIEILLKQDLYQTGIVREVIDAVTTRSPGERWAKKLRER